jgi:hypothetical protein
MDSDFEHLPQIIVSVYRTVTITVGHGECANSIIPEQPMKNRTPFASLFPEIGPGHQLAISTFLSLVLLLSQVAANGQDASAQITSKPITFLSNWIIKTNQTHPSLTPLNVDLIKLPRLFDSIPYSSRDGLSFTFAVETQQPGAPLYASMEIVDSKGSRFHNTSSSFASDHGSSTFSCDFKNWPSGEPTFTLRIFSNPNSSTLKKILVAEFLLANKFARPKELWVGAPLPFSTNIGPFTITVSSSYELAAIGNGKNTETWSPSIRLFADTSGNLSQRPNELSRSPEPIKLSIEAYRREPSFFDDREKWAVRDLKVPPPEITIPLAAKGKIDGKRIELLAIVGAGKLKPITDVEDPPSTVFKTNSDGAILMQTVCIGKPSPFEAMFYRMASENGKAKTNNGFQN